MKLFLLALALTLTWGATMIPAAEDGLLLDLILPAGEGDRFQHVEFSCWVPDVAKPVKAVIIHQHGCTNASPEKHPPITGDWHWRALARKHGCALLVPMYQVAGKCDEWNDPESGSERALMTALDDLARRSGRSEMKAAPWLLWGHSGGSSWSAQMILRHPGRVLAGSFRGGCSKQFGVPEFRESFVKSAHDLPLLFVWGKRETVPTSSHYVSWDPMNAMFRDLRKVGGKVCLVVDPRSEHGCDDSRLMSLLFFDAVLSRDVGGVGDAPAAGSSWVPNAAFAEQWKVFSKKGSLLPPQPPKEAPVLMAERAVNGGTVLRWRISPELGGGLRGVRLYRDEVMWKELAIAEDGFLATSRDSTPEVLRVSQITDPSTSQHRYSMTYLDVGGNESPASAAVSAPTPTPR